MSPDPVDAAAPVDGEASCFGLSVGTPEQFGWLHGIVKSVLVLNLIGF